MLIFSSILVLVRDGTTVQYIISRLVVHSTSSIWLVDIAWNDHRIHTTQLLLSSSRISTHRYDRVPSSILIHGVELLQLLLTRSLRGIVVDCWGGLLHTSSAFHSLIQNFVFSRALLLGWISKNVASQILMCSQN